MTAQRGGVLGGPNFDCFRDFILTTFFHVFYNFVRKWVFFKFSCFFVFWVKFKAGQGDSPFRESRFYPIRNPCALSRSFFGVCFFDHFRVFYVFSDLLANWETFVNLDTNELKFITFLIQNDPYFVFLRFLQFLSDLVFDPIELRMTFSISWIFSQIRNQGGSGGANIAMYAF